MPSLTSRTQYSNSDSKIFDLRDQSLTHRNSFNIQRVSLAKNFAQTASNFNRRQASVEHHLKAKSFLAVPQKKVQSPLNAQLIELYSESIFRHMRSEETKEDMRNFLLRHKISAEYRAKMADWMVEVLTTFECSTKALFLAMSILDRFFQQSQRNLQGSDLHLSGITAMFIAVKYEDVLPLSMKSIVNKIGHGKFTVDQIKQREVEILTALKFRVGQPTIVDYLDHFFVLFPELDSCVFKQFSYQIAKLTLPDYKFRQLPPSAVASSIFYFLLTIKKKQCGWSKEEICRKWKLLSDKGETSLETIVIQGNKICQMATGFGKLYPQLKNLNKVEDKVLDTIKELKGTPQ